MTNTEQVEAWDGETGRHWAEHQDHYDVMLGRLTARLVAAAEISATDRVLDIGCGCGETARIAARQASEGTVLGVDLSGPMLRQARARATEDGLNNVRFEKADAQMTDFAGEAFDLVMSRFGVMFFDDPRAAFANFARSMRPGGRIAFLCWQEVGRNEHLAVPFGAIAAFLPLPDLGDPAGPGPFAFADPERVRDLLNDTGFSAIAVDSVTEPVRIGSDADDAADFLREIPVARTMLGDADKSTAAKALAALREALTSYETPDGVFLGSAAWLVTARRL
jgi:SAM-dependent methyltransferase